MGITRSARTVKLAHGSLNVSIQLSFFKNRTVLSLSRALTQPELLRVVNGLNSALSEKSGPPRRK